MQSSGTGQRIDRWLDRVRGLVDDEFGGRARSAVVSLLVKATEWGGKATEWATRYPGVGSRLWCLEQQRAIAAHDFTSAPTVVIYQMGKVASTAIHDALHGRGVACFHTHRLSDAGIEATRAYYLANGLRYLLPNLDADLLLRRKLLASGSKVDVVTLAREPIAHALSVFLWHIDGQFSKLDQDDQRRWPLILETLRQRFADFDGRTNHHANWFDTELRAVFGVDVYAQPFPSRQGFTLLENDRARVLVLRYEDLDRAFAPGIESLLGMPNVVLPRTNTADEASRGELARYLKANLALTSEQCERIYGTRYAQHFYTQEERARLGARWSNPATRGG